MSVIKKIQDSKFDLTRWRKRLHTDAEVAFEERKTGRFITRTLQSFGIQTHSLAKTGIIGVLHGKNGPGGKAIMLRADMDALPIAEKTGATHQSATPGVHHACGHDGHMTMLLGAAKYLAEAKDFDGTVYFVFQPAEEHGGGARQMIEEKLFEKFPCDEVYGMHNAPELPFGAMATNAGKVLAAAEDFHITFTGSGGHVSHQGHTSNIVEAQAEAVYALYAMAKKEIAQANQATFAVSSVATTNAAFNVLSDKIEIRGSMRTFDAGLQERLKENMERIVTEVAGKHGVTVSIDYPDSCPALENTARETALAADAAADVVGKNRVMALPATMGSEDFACFLEKKPGNYMIIGTGPVDGTPVAPLHSPKYDFNDAALPVGATYWVRLVERALPTLGGAEKAPPKAPPAPGFN